MRIMYILLFLFSLQVSGNETTEKRIKEGSLTNRDDRNVDLRQNNDKPTGRKPSRISKKRMKRVRVTENQRSSSVSNRLENLVLRPDKGSRFNELDIFEGDQLTVHIKEDMIGYGESKRAVRGVVYAGSLKGSILLGHSEMDKKTKELVVYFNKIRNPNNNKTHTFKAEMRLKGRHETKFWTYFWATVGANAVGGFADASKDREPTIIGSRSIISPSNIGRNSMAEGAKAGARIFAEELKNFPEFTVVMGPVLEKLTITEQPDTIF